MNADDPTTTACVYCGRPLDEPRAIPFAICQACRDVPEGDAEGEG